MSGLQSLGFIRKKNHITLKIHQCLRFIEEGYWKNRGKSAVDPLIDLTFRKVWQSRRWRGSDKWDGESLWNDEKGNEFRLTTMSSGERQMLTDISYVLYHIKNIQSIDETNHRIPYHHVCVIFDEVELYFHPEYQRRFLSMLIESLTWTKIDKRKIRSIHFLVATHSPFVLTDILTERTLYLKNGKRQKVNSQTFGGNFYELLDNSFFFDKTAVGGISARAIRRLVHSAKASGRQPTQEELQMIGDPFVRRHLEQFCSKPEE